MNGLLMAGTLFAGGYCWVLARRVNDLKDLDKGLGGSIVTLTRQIELARTTLEEARAGARDNRHELSHLVAKADGAAGQLKLLLAALKEPAPAAAAPQPPVQPEPAPPPAPQPVFQPQPLSVVWPATIPAAAIPVRTVIAPPAPAPRLAEPAQDPEPPAEPLSAGQIPDIPKPRMVPPLANPMRRIRPAAVPQSEDQLMDVLNAIAGGGGH